MPFFDKSSILETTFTGVWTLNAQGELIDVNEQYLIMTKFKKEDLLNKPLAQLDAIGANKITLRNISSLPF